MFRSLEPWIDICLQCIGKRIHLEDKSYLSISLRYLSNRIPYDEYQDMKQDIYVSILETFKKIKLRDSELDDYLYIAIRDFGKKLGKKVVNED